MTEPTKRRQVEVLLASYRPDSLGAELCRTWLAVQDAPVVKLEERSATFGHGDSGRQYVIGDDYMGRPPFASLVGKTVRLVRDGDSGEGES